MSSPFCQELQPAPPASVSRRVPFLVAGNCADETEANRGTQQEFGFLSVKEFKECLESVFRIVFNLLF